MNFLPKNPTARVWLGLAAAFMLPLLYAIYTDVYEPIPARDLTATRMIVTRRRVLQYAQKEHHLPARLADLAPLPSEFDGSTGDAWGRPLDYTYDAAGIVTLKSLGADKAPGGAGDNMDMTGTFSTKDDKGNWLDVNSGWMSDPLKL